MTMRCLLIFFMANLLRVSLCLTKYTALDREMATQLTWNLIQLSSMDCLRISYVSIYRLCQEPSLLTIKRGWSFTMHSTPPPLLMGGAVTAPQTGLGQRISQDSPWQSYTLYPHLYAPLLMSLMSWKSSLLSCFWPLLNSEVSFRNCSLSFWSVYI